MTKEEILYERYKLLGFEEVTFEEWISFKEDKDHDIREGILSTLKAMDEYAKQEAIEFAKWIWDEGVEPCISYSDSFRKGEKYYNATELYELYQQIKNK